MNYFNKKLTCIPLFLLVFGGGNAQPIQVQGSTAEIEAAKHEITTQLQQMQALRGDANQIALARESNRLALINAAKDAQQNSQSAKLAINSSLSEAAQTDKAEIQTRNRIDIANVTQEQMDAVRRKSGLDQFGSKVAQYVTGSPILANSDQGRNVITLIKGLGNPGEQAKNLALIRQYADAKYPEALNFYGYIHEKGLFVAKDPVKAEAFYRLAANQNYPTAIYNLGLGTFYGRLSSREASPSKAIPFFDKAKSIALDNSGRICGWDSYANWRVGNKDAARVIAIGCPSPLASLGQAIAIQNDNEKKITAYAGFFSTGSDDAFIELAQFTRSDYPKLAIEFHLLNKYRWDVATMDSKNLAQEVAKLRGRDANPSPADMSLAGSMKLRIAKFKELKAENKMQFSSAVPYLPFKQEDVILFTKLLESKP
jgi:TPR repeat protein